MVTYLFIDNFNHRLKLHLTYWISQISFAPVTILSVDRQTQSTNWSLVSSVTVYHPHSIPINKAMWDNFPFLFFFFFLIKQPIRERERGGEFKTPVGVSPLVENGTERASAIWEYWTAYHCTNQREWKTLIRSDRKLDFLSGGPLCPPGWPCFTLTEKMLNIRTASLTDFRLGKIQKSQFIFFILTFFFFLKVAGSDFEFGCLSTS